MLYKITNVKVSIKIQEICLDTVSRNLEEKNILFKKYPNYIVIQDIYTFIVFKTSCKKKNSISHVNITKIPTLFEVDTAKKHLKDLFDGVVIKEKPVIDNITVSLDIKKDLTPEKIQDIFDKVCKITFNKETFPGIFLKFTNGTAIIFHTGKCIIIGCKNLVDVNTIANFLVDKLQNDND